MHGAILYYISMLVGDFFFMVNKLPNLTYTQLLITVVYFLMEYICLKKYFFVQNLVLYDIFLLYVNS